MQEVFEKIKQRITIAATEACGYSALTRVISESELKDILESTYSEFNDGWIPCSERLPKAEDLHEISIEDCMCYLIQRRCGVMDVAHYIKVYGEPYFEAHCIKFKDVVAWMPLPEPYKPDSVDTEKPEWKDRMMQTFLGGRR